jgi:hypothetical protein
MRNKAEHRTEQGHVFTGGLAARMAAEGAGPHQDADLPKVLRTLAERAVRDSRTSDAIALQRAALLLEQRTAR